MRTEAKIFGGPFDGLRADVGDEIIRHQAEFPVPVHATEVINGIEVNPAPYTPIFPHGKSFSVRLVDKRTYRDDSFIESDQRNDDGCAFYVWNERESRLDFDPEMSRIARNMVDGKISRDEYVEALEEREPYSVFAFPKGIRRRPGVLAPPRDWKRQH